MNTPVLRIALLLALACATAPATASVRGDLKARAKAGDLVAMRELAHDLNAGLSGRRDRRGAERWARAAIDRGDAPAELVLARTLSDDDRGWLGSASCFWFLSALHQALPDAELPAANCLASRARTEAQLLVTRALYERALANGETDARLLLYRLYDRHQRGWTDAANAAREQEARRLLIAAAEAGELEAMRLLAQALESAPPPERDVPGAVRWYDRAAEAGDLQAMTRLGVLLYEGEGVSDPARAVVTLEAAAARGSVLAMRYLGQAHRDGRGLARDPVASQRWFLAAGRKRDGEGAMQRALHHLDPDSGAFSYRRGRYWLEVAERHGGTGAERRLALLYIRGEGVDPNLKKGLDLLADAARHGDPIAARELVRLKLDGKLVRRDADGALRAAAYNSEKLDAASCTRIGLLFFGAKDMRRDLQYARQWLTRGAERGDTAAMALVAPLLADGLGGPPDATRAAAWRAQAVAAGRTVDVSWRPPAVDRVVARASGASLANLGWEADLDWGARDTIEVLDLPQAGAFRTEFQVNGIQPKLKLTGIAGIELAHGVEQTIGVYLRLLPVASLESAREVTRAELVIEERTGPELTKRTVLQEGYWNSKWHWAEISWDADSVITVRLENQPPYRVESGPTRIRAARAVIDSVSAEFRYLAVD